MAKNLRNLFGLLGEKAQTSTVTAFEETREGKPKAYIPNFFYKPPFGYPRYKDLAYYRSLAASIYVDMCETAIIDEVCSIEWDIVAEDKSGNPVLGKENEIQKIKDFFENPNTNKESWETIVRMMLPDLLELNSGVMVKVFNAFGQMVEIVSRDGMSFTKNPDEYGMYTDRADLILVKNILGNNEGLNYNPYPLLTGYISEDQAKETGAYFQYGFNTGARPVPFGKREIVWFEKKVRTDDIYGRSAMEILAKTVQTLIYAVEHNLEYFSDNSIPPGVLGLEGMNTADMKAFAQQWTESQKKQDELGNWKKAFHKLAMVNKVPKFERLGYTNQELELIESQKWWSKMVWACYDDKTEILTEDGFKLFKDLNKEKVARVNPDGLEIDFIEPIDKQEYDFDGELIKYKTKSCDLLVTPEHKMLQCSKDKFYDGKEKWEPKEAREFNEGIIPQAGNFKGETIEKMHFNSKCKRISKNFDTQEFKITGDNFCKFMGIWLSDGWIESDNNRICLCASDVYPENKKFIEQLLNDMGVDFKIKISEPSKIIQGKLKKVNGLMNYYRFSNKAFSDYLIQFGHSKDKYVPQVILKSDKKQRELFLEYFMLGDGSEGRKGRNDRYGSMSKKLLDGLQEMLIKNGKSATLFKNSYNGSWELTVRQGKSNRIKNKYYSRIIKDNVSKQKYKGKVYDVTVPKYHFLIVRRNGRVSISGNSFGMTATELGFTEDAKGAANQIVQSSLAKKRIIYPLLKLIAYHVNTEIIPEFGFEGIRYKYKIFDVDEETKKWGLYKLQTESGLKSINEVRNAEGLDAVEWGNDSPNKWSPNNGTNINMTDPKQAELNRVNNDNQNKRDALFVKPNKDKVEEKASGVDSVLILQPNERMDKKKLEKAIVSLLEDNKKKIIDVLESQIKEEPLIRIKGIDDIPEMIKRIFSVFTLKKISDEVIKSEFDSGWNSSEKKINRNVQFNQSALEFLQNHAFDNIKGMTEEISNDLKAELERGIINGEGIDKLKVRVNKVFEVGNNRAEMIARTETNRADNNGKLLAIKGSGLEMEKKWVTHFDDRTSELCKHLDGQVVGINENFHYGDWTGQSPPAHISCRSTIVFMEKEDVEKKDIESKPGMGHSDKWWEIYHALIREGHSEESAAKITNERQKE